MTILVIGMPSGWEFVIVALIVLGIPVVVIGLVIALIVRSSRKAKAQKLAVYDQLFSVPSVSYQLAAGALPYEAIVAEATRRGYQLIEQTPGGLLTFTRRPQA